MKNSDTVTYGGLKYLRLATVLHALISLREGIMNKGQRRCDICGRWREINDLNFEARIVAGILKCLNKKSCELAKRKKRQRKKDRKC